MTKKLLMSLAVGMATIVSSATLFATDAENSDPDPSNLVPQELIYTIPGSTTTNVAILGGTVLPHKMVNLIAQMPGEVKYISGEEGDRFEPGTRLVVLDEAALMEKRRAAVAAYNSARAGPANACSIWLRAVCICRSRGHTSVASVTAKSTSKSSRIFAAARRLSCSPRAHRPQRT